MIKIENLTKMYGETCAVAELSLEVPPGEICGLLGPNGAGKTTTIRILNGLARPTSGRVTLGGFDLSTHAREAKRMVGYCPDRPYLYEKLTGYEFLMFVGGLYDLSPDQVARSAQPFLERFGLIEYVGRLIEGYSHGMRQKLMIASSLLHSPRIYIVDEPMVGLDPASARKICSLIREMGSRGVTVLLSTHTLTVAEKVCDRIAILNRGRLVALGRIDELKALTKGEHRTLEEVFLKLTEEESVEEACLSGI